MKTLLTPTPLIAFEVESESKNFEIVENIWYEIGEHPFYIDIPDGEWEILGTVDKGVIDFDCEPYLEYSGEYYDGKLFWCYGEEKDKYAHENEAFLSLLESHSLSLDKKYLIIKPKN